MRFAENSNSDNLYSRPESHVVLKAFSTSKNIAAVDILLLKFMVMWSPASYIEVSYCELLENQTDLHLVSSFPQWIFGLF
jgi:hypothetical protein